MLIYYAVGRLGVQQAGQAAQSALPGAPVIHEQPSWPTTARVRAAGVLHRLADRVGRAGAEPWAHRDPLQV